MNLQVEQHKEKKTINKLEFKWSQECPRFTQFHYYVSIIPDSLPWRGEHTMSRTARLLNKIRTVFDERKGVREALAHIYYSSSMSLFEPFKHEGYEKHTNDGELGEEVRDITDKACICLN